MAKSNPHSRLWLAGAWLLSFVVVALVLEAGARLAESVVNDVRKARRVPAPEWFDYDAEVGWKARPGFRGDVEGIAREFDGNGFSAIDSDDLAVRGPGKIVLIGDSRTFGYRVAEEATFAELLEKAIPGAATVNLALPGYSSYQGRRVLETRGAGLAPAVLVVAFGYNDRRYVFNGEEIDGQKHFSEVAATAARGSVARRVDRCALVRMGRRLLGPGAGKGRTASGPVAANALQPRVDPLAYRANLEAIIAEGRKAGATVVILGFDDNPTSEAPLEAGLRAMASHDWPSAMADFRVATSLQNPLSELGRRKLRETYAASGTAAPEALSTVKRPFGSLHGGDPIEPGGVYLEIARGLAAPPGVVFVDGGAILAAHPETYTDICHFDEQGHRLIAEALATAIVAARSGRE